jgi:guanosine-3',5'-bis(diphosphate) 3'-pyrophosphohydrolase
MTTARMEIHTQVIDAFQRRDDRLAWDLVCHHIGGKDGMSIPNEVLTVESVPTRWSWKLPSAAQAFALTYYGDEMVSKGGPDGCSLFEQVSENDKLERLSSFSLTELRAVLYFIQRASRWNGSDPAPILIRRILSEIRKRLETTSAMKNNPVVLILKATQFAAEKHKNQRRKDAEASPYINHPISLANVLANEGGVTDPVVLCAALLHDTIEDTNTTADELRELFGNAITNVVLEVTDDKSLDKAKRKQLQIEHARHASSQAKLVKLADKICNLRDIAATPPADWTQERKDQYFDWAKAVIDGLRGEHPQLEALFDATYLQK